MEKTIILTGKAVVDEKLVARLYMLFPDCEIQVLSGRTESFKKNRLSLSNHTCRIESVLKKTRKLPEGSGH